MIINVETLPLKTGATLVRIEDTDSKFYPSVIVRQIAGGWFARNNWANESGHGKRYKNSALATDAATAMLVKRIGELHCESVRK
jgi:hypothetical protein